MKILQSVTVKQILTEEAKENLGDKYKQKLQQLDKEINQLGFEEKKQLKNQPFFSEKIKEHFNIEWKKRKEKQNTLEFQLKQLYLLPIGSEITEQEVMSIKEIKIGDVWNNNVDQTIIVKDGIIIDIR